MPSPSGHRYSCPNCGAAYTVSVRTRSPVEDHLSVCTFCGDVMDEWRGKARSYRRTASPNPGRRANAIVKTAHTAKSPARHGRPRTDRARRGP
jgi:hypothetical protein